MAIGNIVQAVEKSILDIGKKPSESQLRCEAQGGRWDEARGVCVMPRKEPELLPPAVPEVPKAKITTPEVFTDPRTGNVSGIDLPGKEGQPPRSFLGLSPDEVAEISARETQRGVPPEGTAPVGTAQSLQTEMTRKLNLAKTVGNIDFETAMQLEEQGLNVKEYLSAGGQGAVKSAIGYGATGAAAGLIGGPAAPVSVPVAATIGAGFGLIKGFYSDVTSNMKAQRQDLVSVKTKELKKRQTAINNYIMAANTNPADAEQYVAAMNIEFSLIRRDYNTLLKRGNEDLEFWGTDATPQLVDYSVYFESIEPSLKLRMEQAVLRPDPTRAILSLSSEVES